MPNCTYSSRYEPEFTKAALQLKSQNSEVRLGKIDVSREKLVGDSFKKEIKGFPTILLFIEGKFSQLQSKINFFLN